MSQRRSPGNSTQVDAVPPAPLASDLRAGTDLAGHRLERLIGRGGMGVVYLAEQIQLQRPVALKLLAGEFAVNPSYRSRFMREARDAAALEHPGIVTVYDAGEAEGLLYISMRYVEGSDLGKLIAQDGPLDPQRALVIAEQVGSALDFAHQHGVVHRDVKPGNILLSGARAFLTDFGVARRMDSETALTGAGSFVGTAQYCAPEQIRGEPTDGRADIYALACVLYHVLAGQPPFADKDGVALVYAHLEAQPPPLSHARPEMPPALDAVIARGMEKRPEDRPDSCAALVTEARMALLGQSDWSREPTLPQPGVSAPPFLVASPEPGVRALLRATLKLEGSAVVEVETAEAALTAARQGIGAAFVAWELCRDHPGLCAALREAGDGRTRVIALAPPGRPLEPAAVEAAGAHDLVARPISVLQVLLAMARVLDPDPEAGGCG